MGRPTLNYILIPIKKKNIIVYATIDKEDAANSLKYHGRFAVLNEVPDYER